MRRIRKETSDYINAFDRLVFDQLREKALDRIVAGLVAFSLVVIVALLVVDGSASIWLLYAIFLLAGAIIAYALRSVGHFVVAAIVLVVVLTGIVAGMLLAPNALNGFVPYLFIPVVIIAGLTLTPPAVIITVISSITLAAITLALSGQLTLGHLLALVPPFSLTVIVGLLVIEGGYRLNTLQSLILGHKQLLRERTWEAVEAQRASRELQQRFDELEKKLVRFKAQQEDQTATRNNKLFGLINGAIHELGSSVNELEQLVERIEELPQPDEQAALLEEVWQKIYHLTNLKVGLTEISRLENDEISLQRQIISITDLIREVAGTAQGLARSKNLKLQFQVTEDLPQLCADPNRLRQALLLILNNAIQYTDEGIIEVHTDLCDHELIIMISDTGLGIEPDETELIFQKFGRASGPISKTRQGPGLGLSISEHLIKLHGGRLWLSSVPGVGSTFYVALPLTKPSTATPTIPPAAAASVTPDQTILSVRPKIPAALPATTPEISHRPRPSKSSLGPVSRFSSTYTGRFGLIALSLFLAITLCVALLALRNGTSRTEEAALPDGSGISTGASPSTENTALVSTATPASTPVILITATSSPTDSLTVLPTISLPATPTPIPTPTVTSLPPTSQPTATPFQPATATPRLSDNPVAAAALSPSIPTPAQPQSPTSASRQLSFITGHHGDFSVGRLDQGNAGELYQAVAIQTTNNSRLSWSPTGQLLFTTDQHGNREIYVANSDGSQPHRLTQTSGDNTHPVWSPDGQKIAFSSGRTGNFEIFVMDTAGHSPTQLTTSRGFDEWPVWSADGQQIAFVSDRDGNVEIYTINADGSNQQRLTHHPADDWPASWSPDGSKLVFSSNRDSNWDLYIVEVDSGNILRLTNDAANEREPVWSPDGQLIAFAYDGNGNWDIFTLPVPPAYLTEILPEEWSQVTNTAVDERYPVWLP